MNNLFTIACTGLRYFHHFLFYRTYSLIFSPSLARFALERRKWWTSWSGANEIINKQTTAFFPFIRTTDKMNGRTMHTRKKHYISLTKLIIILLWVSVKSAAGWHVRNTSENVANNGILFADWMKTFLVYGICNASRVKMWNENIKHFMRNSMPHSINIQFDIQTTIDDWDVSAKILLLVCFRHISLRYDFV